MSNTPKRILSRSNGLSENEYMKLTADQKQIWRDLIALARASRCDETHRSSRRVNAGRRLCDLEALGAAPDSDEPAHLVKRLIIEAASWCAGQRWVREFEEIGAGGSMIDTQLEIATAKLTGADRLGDVAQKLPSQQRLNWFSQLRRLNVPTPGDMVVLRRRDDEKILRWQQQKQWRQ